MQANFDRSLSFVWRSGYDSPADGYHVTPGDTGGGTKGGVIEATWAQALKARVVTGRLADATDNQLSAVLRTLFWGPACDALPSGLDFLLFNGRMMSGKFPFLLQQCLGFMSADDVDGAIGDETIAACGKREAATLIDSVCGVHYAYLAALKTWPIFGRGWSARLISARAFAHSLVATPIA